MPTRLDDIANAAAAPRLPPVHLWNPAHCGEIDIVIKANGDWLHEGALISRPALVRLFSTVLRRDADGVYLVTPVEKLKITVEDAPFVAVGVEDDGGDLVFTTNVGDIVRADAAHAIRVENDPATATPRPYLHIRAGLDALIARPVFYELVERATEREDGSLAVASGGVWFTLGDVAKQAS